MQAGEDRAISLSDVESMLERGDSGHSSDFDLNAQTGTDWPRAARLRPAAVLVPLIENGGRLDVILTKRASHLKHHPGQIAFPGGKTEEADGAAQNTALRESFEEIGLEPGNVRILGCLPFHETVTNFRITPVVGHVLGDFAATPETGEVAEVFRIPLDFLANPANYFVEGRVWAGKKRLYYTIPYGPYYVWGATARILRAMAGRLWQ